MNIPMTQILYDHPQGNASAGKTGFLITFSGIDGSGKSSQVTSLLRTLSGRNINAIRAWAGNKPMLSYPFLALVRVLGYTKRRRIQGLTFVQRDIRRNRALSKLWPIALTLDFVPKAFFSVVIPLRRRRVVVCDRYVYDLLAELRQDEFIGSWGQAILLHLLPKPDLAFLMDVNVELAWRRALVPGRAREQPIYDMEGRRGAYLQLSREFAIVVVDGSRDSSINQSIISRQTMEALERSGFLPS